MDYDLVWVFADSLNPIILAKNFDLKYSFGVFGEIINNKIIGT